MKLSEVVVRIALARAARGVSLETAGRNRGPEVDAYARGVGLDPKAPAAAAMAAGKAGAAGAAGYAWCTSGLYDVHKTAAAEIGSRNPFPRTAKAVQVFQRAPKSCLRSDPAVGYVYVLDHGKTGFLLDEWRKNSFTADGHIGVVTRVSGGIIGADGATTGAEVVDEVSANTNAAGSREGDRWAVHHGSPEVSHKGILLPYIDMDAWLAEIEAGRATP